ncbi:hypothetical protein Tco_1121704 [Tanacetum coccineum]|uniref:Uncharacterized protein n=1 Tax=Tanacetum coccineum TaxID=301880 RepID=A0ABQ5IYG0_9ASTR
MPYPRLKFISKGEEHQVYGKLILDILVTDDMQKYDTYKTFIVLSTGSIPPKKARGKGTQGTKATIIPKKETAASKKKRQKKIESIDEESEEQEESLIRRKPIGAIIQDTSQVSKKKSIDQSLSQKLKGIELLSDATQLEIDTQKAIKASKRKRIFQHPSGGSSKGVGITPEVPDELTGKSAVSDEGACTSPETFLFDDKDEKVEYIPWVSNDEDDDDDEEDVEIIDIKMIDDEKTDTDVED